MPLSVEKNETLDPIDIGFLRPKGIVSQADHLSDAVEQFGLARIWGGR
jgi:hypothetical protein